MYRIQREARHLPKTLTLKLATDKGNINKITLHLNTPPQARAYRSYALSLKYKLNPRSS